MALLLTDAQVREAVTMDAMMDAVEDMHRHYAMGEAVLAERRNVIIGESQLALMGGGLTYLGLYGAKTYTTVQGRQQYHVTLYDASTGTAGGVHPCQLAGGAAHRGHHWCCSAPSGQPRGEGAGDDRHWVPSPHASAGQHPGATLRGDQGIQPPA